MGEWGKGGLVVAAEEGLSSLAAAIKEAKRASESVLLPIVDKVVNDVKIKAKIAQNAFEAAVLGVMDLVEEVGATMGPPRGSQNEAKDESEVTSSSSSVPSSVNPSQSSAEDAAVVGEKEPYGEDEDNKKAEKQENVEKEENMETMEEPTTTGESV